MHQESQFLECNYERAKFFYAQHPKDESEEAQRFQRKARQLLVKGKEVLDSLGVRFWLSSGTCLGMLHPVFTCFTCLSMLHLMLMVHLSRYVTLNMCRYVTTNIYVYTLPMLCTYWYCSLGNFFKYIFIYMFCLPLASSLSILNICVFTCVVRLVSTMWHHHIL